MLQTKTKRYDINTLSLLNESYRDDHTLTEGDLTKLNLLVEQMESSRFGLKLKTGDRLLYTSKHVDYSPVDFIEKSLYSDDCTFEEEKEYRDFLQTFCATVFSGYWDNLLVIWCYRDELRGLPLQEWEAINAPVTTRKIGTLPTDVKVQKDHEKHEVITFYIRPE